MVLHYGPVPVDPPLILAPMAGVTDQDFRLIVRRIEPLHSTDNAVCHRASQRHGVPKEGRTLIAFVTAFLALASASV